MNYNSKYTGQQVEDLLDQVASGNAGGGGGGIAVETDPIFSASPAAGITEEQIVAWDDLSEMVNLLDKDVATLTGDVQEVQESLTDLDTIRSGSAKGATAVQPGDIENVARLDEEYVVANGIVSKEDVYYYLPDTNTSDATHTLATKGDLSSAIETYIADFTMESLREGMNNSSQVTCDIQALVTAMNANKIILVREFTDSYYDGVNVLNGYAEDLLYFSIVDSNGDVLYCDGTDYVYTKSYIDGQTLFYRSWADKQDKLQSGENIKTINGENILGSGDITIEGGVGTITGVSANGTSIATSGVADIPAASTSKYGVTKLTTLTNSSSTTLAATASAVKIAYDLANSKQDKLESGTNIKTINGASILGSGDITISGGTGTVGPQGPKGDNGADGATFTPSVDSAGNLSWTNNKGLANPPTVNIKGPKGDKGDAGEGGGSGGSGKEIVLSQYIHFNDTNPAQPNKIYISSRAMTATYIGAFQEVSNYDEYCIIFKYPEDGVTLPESVKFANGQMSTIEYDTECELSVVGIGSGANRTYHAVITPFKTL